MQPSKISNYLSKFFPMVDKISHGFSHVCDVNDIIAKIDAEVIKDMKFEKFFNFHLADPRLLSLIICFLLTVGAESMIIQSPLWTRLLNEIFI